MSIAQLKTRGSALKIPKWRRTDRTKFIGACATKCPFSLLLAGDSQSQLGSRMLYIVKLYVYIIRKQSWLEWLGELHRQWGSTQVRILPTVEIFFPFLTTLWKFFFPFPFKTLNIFFSSLLISNNDWYCNLVCVKLTSPTPTLQETGPTVLRPIREDEAMWVKRLA